MKIYTRGGDKGKTSLIGGARVAKWDKQVEAYGTVDELKAQVAMAAEWPETELLKQELTQIVEYLFVVESLVASATKEDGDKMPQLPAESVTALEQAIDRMDEQLRPLQAFVLPGGSMANAQINVARAVCRRAERAVLRLWDDKPALMNPLVTAYLNRLSDYLFTLSRFVLHQQGIGEKEWLP